VARHQLNQALGAAHHRGAVICPSARGRGRHHLYRQPELSPHEGRTRSTATPSLLSSGSVPAHCPQPTASHRRRRRGREQEPPQQYQAQAEAFQATKFAAPYPSMRVRTRLDFQGGRSGDVGEARLNRADRCGHKVLLAAGDRATHGEGHPSRLYCLSLVL
jgi:hypothetical protein